LLPESFQETFQTFQNQKQFHQWRSFTGKSRRESLSSLGQDLASFSCVLSCRRFSLLCCSEGPHRRSSSAVVWWFDAFQSPQARTVQLCIPIFLLLQRTERRPPGLYTSAAKLVTLPRLKSLVGDHGRVRALRSARSLLNHYINFDHGAYFYQCSKYS
jgi:hypothetical protein